MMRAWGNRADTVVCDEPLYAHYLQATGVDHPGRDEVIAYHETDWRKVVADLTGPIPDGKTIYYQKHMSHHLLPDIGREWLAEMMHGFLIRDPREMLTSLLKNVPHPTLTDTGLPQQVELVTWIQEKTGRVPPIIDARDVLENPREVLTRLCDSFGAAFDESMLRWPAGRRETDGVWAKYWYDAVENSTGFGPYVAKNEPVPERLLSLLDECMECYAHLHALRMRW